MPHPLTARVAHVLQAFAGKLNDIAQPMRTSWTDDRGKGGLSAGVGSGYWHSSIPMPLMLPLPR
jgi:hypothetical protein